MKVVKILVSSPRKLVLYVLSTADNKVTLFLVIQFDNFLVSNFLGCFPEMVFY